MIAFTKYTGCGNDFILIDNRENGVDTLSPPMVSHMCDRHRGIGADGVILLESSDKGDYKMRIFNADGSEAEMCGNGLRCLGRFIQQCGDPRTTFVIETKQRLLNTKILGEEVEIAMGDVTDLSWTETIDLEGKQFSYSFLNTGVPHIVLFVEEIDTFNLAHWGPALRHHPCFAPAGTNVNIVQIKEGNVVSVRTYERGVEAETLACGTGATAAALAASMLYELCSPVEVEVKSGDKLKIFFTIERGIPKNICLSGPATSVFDGHFRINSIK